MKNYKEFPPLKYFIRVLKSCPKSALLYAQVWKKTGRQRYFITSKRDIRKDFLISPTIFRNLMAPLVYLNLIDVYEIDGSFKIDILGTKVNEE